MVPARGARTVAPAGVGEGGATERGWGGERQSVSIFTPTITRREEGPFVAGHRAPRRAISPRPRTGHPPEHRVMGAAVEQAKGKGGGGGVGAAPPLGVHAGAGWRNYTSSSLLATSGHSRGCGLGQVAYDVDRLSVQPRAQRAPHGEVPISPQTLGALAWSPLRDEAVRNRCAEVVDSSAALRSGSPQTSVRWSIPVGTGTRHRRWQVQ